MCNTLMNEETKMRIANKFIFQQSNASVHTIK